MHGWKKAGVVATGKSTVNAVRWTASLKTITNYTPESRRFRSIVDTCWKITEKINMITNMISFIGRPYWLCVSLAKYNLGLSILS